MIRYDTGLDEVRSALRAHSDHSEPVFNIPAVVLALLGIMALIQLWRGTLGVATDQLLVARLAFVPGRLTFAFDPVGVIKHVAGGSASANVNDRMQAVWARLFLQRGSTAPWTVLTYAFLHGGWTHLGLNGVWMVAFGTPVARRFGAGRFLALMAVAAVFGAIAHWACYPFGFAPVVGASAAISGLMGAALRFMFQGDPRSVEASTSPALRLMDVFRERRAVSFILVWFATNTLFGMGAGSLGLSDAPVAWQAHVGGFVAGLLLFPWFDPMRDRTAVDHDASSVPEAAASPHED